MEKASASISDGDLVDSLIHGCVSKRSVCAVEATDILCRPEQHWSLMPLHAVCSTVRPASFLYGMGAAYGGPNAMTFPQYVPPRSYGWPLTERCCRWLGQNSKQGKLTRQLTEVQARMRLHVSGDKSEIRQSYIPAMFPHIVKPLMEEGAVSIECISI